jgi:carbamoyltransferase
MRDRLNKDVKRREWFRPFAPSVLENECRTWFEIAFPTPFMLFIAKVLRPEAIPAVTHVDGTARLQTVNAEDNELYVELLTSFANETGVPVLLNTSLNGNNEPLVETPADAFRFFAESPVDMLVFPDAGIVVTR